MRTILMSTAAALVLVAGAASAEPGGNHKSPGGGNGQPQREAAQDRKPGGNAQLQKRPAPTAEVKAQKRASDIHDTGFAPQGQAARKEPVPATRSLPAEVVQRIPEQETGKAGKQQAVRQTVQQVRPLPQGVRRAEFVGPKGRKIFVPTSERVRVVTTNKDVDWLRTGDRKHFYDGCPPGLARKYNGCTPPGLDKPMTDRWAQPDWYLHDWDPQARYRYVDGYMLRLGPGGQVASYVPLLGGALAIGQVWPGSYSSVALPAYYSRYYGLGLSGSYRYYDDTIYRVDPGTMAIASIAALLTGSDIEIGQPMPSGYDVYNVPYRWRSQYRDGPDSLYRYSDGYIYQVDPTTRLVQAAIELVV